MNNQSTNLKQKELEHLVVIGFDDIVANKYITCIEEAINQKYIDGYSVIDLEIQRGEIENKIEKLKLKPENVIFLKKPEVLHDNWADPSIFEPVIEKLRQTKGKLKIYIATELKAHEGYLRYCVEKGIDTLVEKPVIAPMKNGTYAPELIEQIMNSFVNNSKRTSAKHSVMTLSRYHKIYNTIVIESLKEKVLSHKAPVTSFHFRHAGGVWNLHREYDSREDHPYKYGYGMIMHGGYHYIDLTVQILELNKLIFPNSTFSMTLSSFASLPKDQNDRIPKKYSSNFDDYHPKWSPKYISQSAYGETDIVTSFCLTNKSTGKTVTVGTISLEQTTPSIRTWKDIPDGLYNKNGRTSSVNFEAQLSTLHATNVTCFDVPICNSGKVDRIDASARVSTRTNASLLPNEEYNTEKTYSGLFHSDSNRQLMSMWLQNKENKSQLTDHVRTMRLVQYLSMSVHRPGQSLTFDFM
jgi:hypothetical protein